MHLDPRAAADALTGDNRKLLDFEAIGSSKFITRIATAPIGNTWLIAHMSSPCNLILEQDDGFFLAVPFVGSARMTCEGKTFDFAAGANAAIFPNARRTTKRSFSSSVFISVDQDAIKSILAYSFPDLWNKNFLSEFYHLDLVEERSRFQSFARICSLIDSLFDNAQALEILGVEDVINRWIVSCLLRPAGGWEGRVESHRLDIICDLVRASVDRPLTLTEMERVSGLSARALQYAFMARFGCSPMQWQRKERLLGARQRVLSMGPGDSITSIAHSMGYSSSSAFSTLYKRQFGETPSETLQGSR